MNHDGSLGNAIRLAEVAAEAGADAVKFQLHDAQAETTRDAPSPPYFQHETRWEYFERTAFTDAQWATLKAACDAAGIEFLCSAFSVEALERLERIGVARHKIPSGEVTNLELVRAAAATGKPVLLSSGMSSWAELDAAVEAAGDDVTVFQCTSAYPTPPERVGLNLLAELRERYGRPVGLSDHTLGPFACYAAVALGADAVEKHFTLSQELYGPDAALALEPDALEDLVDGDPRDRGDARLPGGQGRPRALQGDEGRVREERRRGERHPGGRDDRARDAGREEARHRDPGAAAPRARRPARPHGDPRRHA